MATLERAIEIATKAHRGQQDKAGKPYILHPLRVMFRMVTEVEMIVAVLHDVVEDCDDWTPTRLRSDGFSNEVLEALDGVTNREGESYTEFVERASRNPVSRRVKIADIEDNMDIRRLEGIAEKDAARLHKYIVAWRKLTGA